MPFRHGSTPRLRRVPLFLALGIALAAPGQVLAADDADAGTAAQEDHRHEQPKDLEQVIVTATPSRLTAEDLIQPIEVLASDRLDAAKAATLGETVGKLPGVQSSFFGAGVGRPVLRGLDGPRVAVLSGGLGTQDVSTVSQDHAVGIEPFLADQIEVLKGPATLLYGSGAIGGLVNVVDGRIAERPLDETVTGRAEIRRDTVSDGDTAMARVDAMGAGGAMVLHADGLYRNQKDYDTPLGVQRNSFIDTKTAALGASVVLDQGFIGAAASLYENRYGNPGEPGDTEEGEASVHLDMKQSRFEFRGGIDRPFGVFNSARASLAHTIYEHTEFEGEEVGTKFLNDGTEGRLELTHKPLGRWTGVVGLQGSDRSFEAIGEEAFVPSTSTTAMGLFLTEQGVWDKLTADLGARIDRVESSPAGAGKRSFDPVSLSAGLGWHFSEAWRLNVNLDRAERAPAEEELFADGPHVATDSFEIGDASLDLERATQAELGVHYHSDRLDAKASAYETRFDGFIYLVDTGLNQDDLPVRQWSQADAKFRGFEGEVTAHLIDNDTGSLDLRVFGDRVRATLDDGGNLPRIAPSRIGADIAWVGNALRASVGAVRYQRQDDVAAGETSTDGYTLVNAHLAWHFDYGAQGYELFLDGSNLTDEEARVHTSFLKDRVILPGRGMAFGVRMFF